MKSDAKASPAGRLFRTRAKRPAAQVERARLVVFLVTMIVVLTGILVGLLLRPPEPDTADPQVVRRLPLAVYPATPIRPPEIDPALVPQPQPEPVPVPLAAESRLVIVIDDVGHNLQELGPFLEFPAPLTFAILPLLPYSAGAAELVRSHGHDVILHLPMPAVSGLNPGPGAISAELSEDEIRRLMDRGFASITGAFGANNHMGSEGTADPRLMEMVMAYLAEKGKFFMDSRTTADTVASAFAAKHGVPFAQRDVFLDHDRDPAAIRAALEHGLRVARTQGYAILIGHSAVPDVAEALLEVYPRLEAEGYSVVPLSTVFPARVAAALTTDNAPSGS